MARETFTTACPRNCYSTCGMRVSVEDGRLRTIEIEERFADFAEQWIARSEVQARVEVHRGAGADVLAGFEDRSADAAFLDADKAGYPVYLRHAMRILRPGGLLMVDNAFAFGQLLDEHPSDAGVPAVRRSNESIVSASGE